MMDKSIQVNNVLYQSNNQEELKFNDEHGCLYDQDGQIVENRH